MLQSVNSFASSAVDLSENDLQNLLKDLNSENLITDRRRTSIQTIISETQFRDVHFKVRHMAMEYAREIFKEDDLFNLDLQITLYKGEDKGHYDWHTDRSESDLDLISANRVLSFSILLSDDFEGGQFEFEDFEFKGLNKKFDMVMFYSNLRHRVAPVIKGNRYSLVGWLSGVRQNNG